MKTKNWIGILLVSALVMTLFQVPPGAGAADTGKKIGWLSYQAAREKNQDQSQKYFLYFSSRNCGYCRMLESKTFSQPQVSAYINENYIPVQVDVDKDRKVAARYRIQGVPDLRFLSKDGAVIGRWVGFTEADHLLKLLKYIQTDSYQTMSFNDFTKQ